MSHHHTTVTVTNINVYIASCNAARHAGGLGPLPPGTKPNAATVLMKTALKNLVSKAWGVQYPDIEPASVVPDTGFIYPMSALTPGVAPACVVDQIALNFQNWGLPGTKATATAIAETVTEELTRIISSSSTSYILASRHTVSPGPTLWTMSLRSPEDTTGVV